MGIVLCQVQRNPFFCISLLKKNLSKNMMVFFSSCNSVKCHSELLGHILVDCLDIHGKRKQQKQTSTFFDVSKVEKDILICTDTAAHGLDISDVNWMHQKVSKVKSDRGTHSHTSRHLAEFWMVEPEIAFADLKDDMNCAEAYVKFLCQWLPDNCIDDMEFMAKNFDKGSIDHLRMVASMPFERISYAEAIKLLEEAVKKDKKFENKVEWGIDLASEHDQILASRQGHV